MRRFLPPPDRRQPPLQQHPARQPLPPDHQLLKYLRKYTDFFADLCLQGAEFQQAYEPSLLASAIVVAARRCMLLRPEWNPELRALTRYSEADLAPVLGRLWEHYSELYPTEAALQNAQMAAVDAEAAADRRAAASTATSSTASSSRSVVSSHSISTSRARVSSGKAGTLKKEERHVGDGRDSVTASAMLESTPPTVAVAVAALPAAAAATSSSSSRAAAAAPLRAPAGPRVIQLVTTPEDATTSHKDGSVLPSGSDAATAGSSISAKQLFMSPGSVIGGGGT